MKKNNDRDMTPHAGCTFESVARVTKLFGGSDGGGVVLSLYDSFPEDFDPAEDPLFVQIDSLDVPLWCASFERRGARVPSSASTIWIRRTAPRNL